MIRALNLSFIDIAGICMEPLVHEPNIKNDNSQINRGSTIWINEVFLTLMENETFLPQKWYQLIMYVNELNYT